MGSSSFLMNVIQVLQTDDTVETDTQNLSAKALKKALVLTVTEQL